MSERKRNISGIDFVKSIFKFSISSWVNFIISILSVSITTRVFSPEVYGNITMFNTVSSLLMGVVCLGLDSGFMRYYNEPPKNFDVKQLLARCLGIPVLLLVGSTVLFVPVFYKTISNLLFNSVSLLVVLLLSINAFSLVVLYYFSVCYRISNNAKKYTIQSILVQIFTKCFVISAALFKPNFNTIIIFNTMGMFVLTIIYYFIQKSDILPNKINWSLKGFSEIFRYSLYSWPIIVLIYLNTTFSQIIITKKLGSNELGIYASTGFFVGALSVLQNGFKTYWAAFMFSNYKTEQSKITKVHDYVSLFAVFILGGFILFQNVLYSLIGTQYHGSRQFFTLVMVFPLFSLISETTSYGISISKKTYYSLMMYLVSTIINLTSAFLLIQYYGLIGVALSTTLSATFQVTVSSIIGQKYYRTIKNPKKTLISLILIVILACFNCIFVENYNIMFLMTLFSYVIAIIVYNSEVKVLSKLVINLIKKN